MGAAILDWCVNFLSLSWLTGPVFHKELRVSSRRRRSYVLRGLYVLAFAVLTSLVWHSEVLRSGSSAYQVAQMSRAGIAVVEFVVWFQFLTVQVLAVVMLSTAVSDEIYHRTLGLLMTTPINSLQIVSGKLLSRLLQLMLLVSISLPMLAIVRVFGGVPWNYVIFGLCVTLSTAVFYGSVSLFFSIFTRRAYLVIIRTLLVGVLLYAVLPVVLVLSLRNEMPEKILVSGIFYLNPYLALALAGEWMQPRSSGYSVFWPLHCGITLGISSLILALAMVFVRKAALRQVTGQGGALAGRRRAKTPDGAASGRIRRVVGLPILWKERRMRPMGRWTPARVIASLVGGGMLLLAYVLCFREKILDEQGVQVAFIVAYALIGMLGSAILPATCITTEKESQSWPILLTTTVSNSAIIGGKLLGVLPRCFIGWGLLFVHLIVFADLGYIHSAGIVQFAILALWVNLFFCGTGLYFSTRIKHTTTAVIANVTLAIVLWMIVPLVVGFVNEGLGNSDEQIRACLGVNPLAHAAVITEAVSKPEILRYEWGGKELDATEVTRWLLFNLAGYWAVSLAFLYGAWRRVRYKPV